MERDEISSRQAGLSEAKRALLERWKRGQTPTAPGPEAAAAPGAIGRRPDAGPAPLSFSQQRLWFLDQLDPGNPAYNLAGFVRLSGPLDRRALANSFQEVTRRHEILRTVFRLEGGEPRQIVLPAVEIDLPLIDLAALPAGRRDAEAAERARGEAGRSFELGTGPLVRAALLRMGPTEHALLLTLHHILADGWSLGVLLRELATAYAGAPLPALPLQYADFAAWQRRALTPEALATDLAYWKRQLHSAPSSLELPSDRLRPAVRSFHGGSTPAALPPAGTAALAELARREGATLFMALLAVFQTLLLRYSGQDDLLVGSPVAGRSRRELEGVIGLFVNTLVLRGDLAGDPTFLELLGRTRRAALDAFQHQGLPFERLVEEIQPDRDLGRNPLFQVMFALQNTPLPEISLAGLHLRQEDLESRAAMFDLTLSLRERAGEVSGSLEFSADLFEPATARRLLAHFGRLVAGAAEDPSRRLSELPLLTEEERRQLLAWNEMTVPFVLEPALHERIAAWGTRTPDGLAVIGDDGRSLTYGELDRRSNQLARRLRRLGVGPDVPVGLCVGRSPEMALGILGILKAGGAYLPLDISYPRERLALMIEDSKAPVLLTQGRTDLAIDGAAVLQLDEAEGWGEIAGEDDSSIASGTTIENLAYVIYTSGSTGRPKGVAVPHRSVLNIMADLERRRALRPGEACALWTSISFDVSVWEIFSALCYGGVLCLPGEEERMHGETLFPYLARHRVVSAYLPPFLLADYAEWVREAPEPGEDRRTLARLLVGVEPLRERMLVRLKNGVPGLEIINGYGPTEATVCATFYDLGDGPVAERRTPLGLPVANCRVHALDEHLHEVPVGVPGELFIGGAGLARGYLGRPDLTAERFVPDPIVGWGSNASPGAAPGARCYRTGDLARRLPEGWLEFVGRRDQQVKVRGFRIELREVEANLALHPGVREVVVTVKEDPRGDKRLVAYVVPAEVGDVADVGGWREHLRQRLPEFMVPATFVPLAAMPLTPSAKVDRRALPEPDWSLSGHEGGYVAPRTPTETLLAGIWSDLLGRGPVGAVDDFFVIGGHSLLAARVISRLREVFAVELPLRALFEARTLSALAERIDGVQRAGVAQAAPPLTAGARDGGEILLSFAQQRLWFLDQLEPGSPLYNIPGAVRLTGHLEPARLAAVLAAVARRHEVLRTTFRTVDGRPVPVVAPDAPAGLPLVDLSGLPEAVREEELSRRIAEEARRPFDLSRGPLLRSTLVRLGPQDHAALLTFHHIAADGWSVGVLLREVMALYGEAHLPELPVQYPDFAAWQRGWLQGDVLESQLAYWRGQLAGAPRSLELPTDRPRPAEPSRRGGVRAVALPEGLSRRLADFCRAAGVTPFMALLAAYATLLGRWAGQRDLLVGTPVANRNRREVEDLIGFFVNTLVLRVDLIGDREGDPGFRELAGRVRRSALDAYAHQDLPFERLVDEIAPERDLARSPLFQVMLALQNAPAEALELPDLCMTPLPAPTGTAKFDLLLALQETEAGLRGTLEYDADLFDRTTAGRLLAGLERLLEGALAEPDRPVADLPLLAESERQQTLLEWNDTATMYPTGVTLHELIAAQAARTPDAIAAVYEDDALTYAELERRAGALAYRLADLGVPADGRVGVLMERSLEMIVALLGAIQAGAAYVPLDPTYPAERLQVLIESAGIGVVVTTKGLAAAISGVPAVLTVLDVLDPLPDPPPLRGRGRPLPAGEDSLAYVIYTSGSTGTPKGVMIPHRGIVNRLLWMQEAYRLTPADRVLQKTPFSFDVSVWEFFWPLITGARLVFARPEGHKDPAYLAGLIAREGVTTLHFVPSMLQAFLEAPGLASLASVRQVMASGEALPPDLARRFFTRIPHAELHNLYGPTEASVDVSFWACAPDAERVPIGRPIANISLHVVDRALRPQPVGVPGELLLGGVGLARGYLARPDLTAAAFVPDPFGPLAGVPGGRLYRTGDLARTLPDGNVEYLGRIDHQVKIRGFRIELGEIETHLEAHPAVRQAVVLARTDGNTPKRLVAYLVMDGEDLDDVRAFLRRRLPEHMVPTAFVVLPELPLTRHGKVDRAALPAPERERASAAAGHAEPQTPAERALAEVWRQVLGLEKVGVNDNFFDLGGDSILGIQVVSRAQQAGLGLTPKDLFRHQTIAMLATVAAVAVVEGKDERDARDGEDESGEIGLTPIQRWFFELELADPHHYNQALLLDLRERAEPARLAAALAAVVARHAALRSRFEPGGAGGWRQVTVPAAEVPTEATAVAALDLSGLPEDRRRGALESAAAALQGSLDLGRCPLLRAALFDLGEGRQRLFLVLHHLIVDGVSWRILLGDLESAWRGLPLLPVPTSLGRWADLLAGQDLSAEASYWLAPARSAVRPLPVDRTEGEDLVASSSSVVAELSEEETRALLEELPSVYHTRINDALLTALAQAFAGWTGEPRLLVDLEGHGREEAVEGADASRTVGWLTALFPVLLDLDRKQADPGEQLKAVKEQLRAVPRGGIGYGLLRYLGDPGTAARLRDLPAAEVVFNYLGQLDRGLPESALLAPAPESGGSPRSPRQRRDHLLEINGGVSGGRLRLTWTYSENRHARATVEALAGRFTAALRALIERSRSSGAGGYTPSDFAEARISQKDLDKLMSRIGKRGPGPSRGR